MNLQVGQVYFTENLLGFRFMILNPNFNEDEEPNETNIRFLPPTRDAETMEWIFPKVTWAKVNVKAQIEDDLAPVYIKEPIYLQFQAFAKEQNAKAPLGLKHMI